jgi:very-short-patch-repair endonuclease
MQITMDTVRLAAEAQMNELLESVRAIELVEKEAPTEVILSDFVINIENLVSHIGCKKHTMKRFLKKNFQADTHYTIKPFTRAPSGNGGRGGHNRETILLTQQCAELIKTSYNLKHKYMPLLQMESGTLRQVQTIMSLENQTIGFIASCLEGVVPIERQMKIGRYAVDLCIPSTRLILECDELNHVDRDAEYELARQRFLEADKWEILRFNPNAADFDLSFVMRSILRKIIAK